MINKISKEDFASLREHITIDDDDDESVARID
jgi:hypothetical protein